MAREIKQDYIVKDKGSKTIKDVSRKTGKSLRGIEKQSKKTTSSMTKNWKKLAGVMVAVLAFKEIIGGFKSVIKATSDLQEVTGKFNVVFKGQMNVANESVKLLRESYLLSTRAAREYLSSVQDLLVPMGLASDLAANLSSNVVQLSSDLGSFNNLPTQKVMEDMQSALVGNYETMKKYGVVLNETTIKEELLSQGVIKSKNAIVTASEKAQAAWNLMVRGSKAAIGDTSRTFDSFANQMRLMKSNVEEFKTTIGPPLLKAVNTVITKINEWYYDNEDFIKQNLPKYVERMIDWLKQFVIVLSDIPQRFELVKMAMKGKLSLKELLDLTQLKGIDLAEAVDAQKLYQESKGIHKVWKEINDEISKLQDKNTELLKKYIKAQEGLTTSATPWGRKLAKKHSEDLKKELDLVEKEIGRLFKVSDDFGKVFENMSKEASEGHLKYALLRVKELARTIRKEIRPYTREGKDPKEVVIVKSAMEKKLIERAAIFGTPESLAEAAKIIADLKHKFRMEDQAKELAFKQYMDNQILDMNAEKLSKIIAQEEEAKRRTQDMYMNLGEGITDAFTSVGMSIRGVIQDTMTWADVVENTLNRISDAFMQLAMDLLKMKMLTMFAQMVANWGAGAAAQEKSDFYQVKGYDASGNIITGANGGVIPGGFQSFATGGIANKPTLGLIGEGKMNEAVVPLPDGKSIPVEGGGGGGGTTNIVIQALDSESFFDAMRRNPEAIINVISEETNKGNNKLMSSINRAGSFA